MSRITSNPIVRRVTLVVFVLVAGCASAPRYRVEVGADVVRSSDPDVAADVAELLVSGRARLAQRVPDLEDTGVEVWVREPTRAESRTTHPLAHNAYTLKRPDQRPRIHVSIHGYRDVFQHELTHALLGASWRTLPLAAEEGLCSLLNGEVADAAMTIAHLRCAARAGGSSKYFVSIRIPGPTREPAREPTEYTSFWGYSRGSDASESTLTVAQILALSDSRPLETMTPGEIGHVYGVGLVVVRRIVASSGIEGLHGLCVRAAAEGFERIPVRWLVDAASIESDEHVEEIAREAMRSESVRAAFESESFESVVRRAVLDVVKDPSDGVDDFLERIEATLRLDGTPIDLRALPAFRSWLSDNWVSLRAPVSG